jgi:aldehyde:ferredoxin oxidoreductase
MVPEELPFFAESYKNTTVENTTAVIRGINVRFKEESALGIPEYGSLVEEETAETAMDTGQEQFEEEAELTTPPAGEPGELEGWAESVVYYEDSVIVNDCLSACKFVSTYGMNGFDDNYQAALFSAGSGVEASTDALHEVAGKIRHLERAFCAREGMTRETDSLPRQFMDKPLEEGPSKGAVLKTSDLEAVKDRYYALRGWDLATGIPSRETLEAAGLGDVAQDLEERGNM